MKPTIDKFKEYASTTNGVITLAVSFTVVVIIAFMIQSMMPKKGSIIYGLCSVFLEQQMTFPHTVEHTYVEMYRRAVRIYYKNFDAYGQQNFSYVECSFVQDPQKGVQLDNVVFKNPVKDITEKYYDEERKRVFHRVKLDKVDLFNQSASPLVIMSQEPDLTLPDPKAMF